MPLSEIYYHINDFIEYAKQHPELKFIVTQIGCGLADYEAKEIAPAFADAPENCILPNRWRTLSKPKKHASLPGVCRNCVFWFSIRNGIGLCAGKNNETLATHTCETYRSRYKEKPNGTTPSIDSSQRVDLGDDDRVYSIDDI